METATRTIQITIPKSDTRFLKRLSGSMGWRINSGNTRHIASKKEGEEYYDTPQFYKDIDQAESDIAQGKGLRVNTKSELDALFV